jgi:predicted RNA-binding protein associated with RNAse of E/G family
MNDKIYEFATRADLITFESIHDSMAVAPSIESVSKAQKFADLIVKECMNIVGDGTVDGEIYHDRIKHHFGVKE